MLASIGSIGSGRGLVRAAAQLAILVAAVLVLGLLTDSADAAASTKITLTTTVPSSSASPAQGTSLGPGAKCTDWTECLSQACDGNPFEVPGQGTCSPLAGDGISCAANSDCYSGNCTRICYARPQRRAASASVSASTSSNTGASSQDCSRSFCAGIPAGGRCRPNALDCTSIYDCTSSGRCYARVGQYCTRNAECETGYCSESLRCVSYSAPARPGTSSFSTKKSTSRSTTTTSKKPALTTRTTTRSTTGMPSKPSSPTSKTTATRTSTKTSASSSITTSPTGILWGLLPFPFPLGL